MLSQILLTAVLATGALASPVECITGESDLEWISKNSSLPKVVYVYQCSSCKRDTYIDYRIYSTGGTILSASNYSRLDNVAYGSGVGPTVPELIANVSEVLDVAQLAFVRFPAPGGSAGINSTLYLNVTQYANRHLCAEDSDIAGAIMFHGTNTLEETVWTPTNTQLTPEVQLKLMTACYLGLRCGFDIQLFKAIHRHGCYEARHLHFTRRPIEFLSGCCCRRLPGVA